MTPGLAGPPFPSKATKGSMVAIASIENSSVPMVVGSCEIDVSSLGSVKGAKGHAVQTAHWCGDELWAWSTSGRPGLSAPERLDGWIEDVPEGESLAQQAEDLDPDEDGGDDGGVSLRETRFPETQSSNENQFVNGEDAPENELFEKVDTPAMTTKGSYVDKEAMTDQVLF